MIETRVQTLQPDPSPSGREGGRPARILDPALLPTLTAMSHKERRQLSVSEPIPGAIYRGRLVGYGRGRGGRAYAVVDTGRELTALRTDDLSATPGREVKVEAREQEDGRKRRALVWRLGEDEREQERGHAR